MSRPPHQLANVEVVTVLLIAAILTAVSLPRCSREAAGRADAPAPAATSHAE